MKAGTGLLGHLLLDLVPDGHLETLKISRLSLTRARGTVN